MGMLNNASRCVWKSVETRAGHPAGSLNLFFLICPPRPPAHSHLISLCLWAPGFYFCRGLSETNASTMRRMGADIHAAIRSVLTYSTLLRAKVLYSILVDMFIVIKPTLSHFSTVILYFQSFSDGTWTYNRLNSTSVMSWGSVSPSLEPLHTKNY